MAQNQIIDSHKYSEPYEVHEAENGIVCFKRKVNITEDIEAEYDFASFTNNGYRREQNIELSEIPFEFRNKRINDFKAEKYCDRTKVYEAIKIAKAYVKNFKQLEGYGLFIYSKEEGTGKTLLASCIANELIEQYGTTVKFFRVIDLMSAVKREMNSKEDPYRKKDSLETAFKAPLLILDDIGAENATEWIKENIRRIVTNRANNSLPTIYTCLHDGGRFKYDKSTTSIIKFKSRFIGLPDESIRNGLAKYQKGKFDKLLEE